MLWDLVLPFLYDNERPIFLATCRGFWYPSVEWVREVRCDFYRLEQIYLDWAWADLERQLDLEDAGQLSDASWTS